MGTQPTNELPRTQPSNEVSAEPESKLWEASKQYMQGDINLQELEQIEKTYKSSPFESTSLADYYTADARSGISSVIDHVVDFVSSLFS